MFSVALCTVLLSTPPSAAQEFTYQQETVTMAEDWSLLGGTLVDEEWELPITDDTRVTAELFISAPELRVRVPTQFEAYYDPDEVVGSNVFFLYVGARTVSVPGQDVVRFGLGATGSIGIEHDVWGGTIGVSEGFDYGVDIAGAGYPISNGPMAGEWWENRDAFSVGAEIPYVAEVAPAVGPHLEDGFVAADVSVVGGTLLTCDPSGTWDAVWASRLGDPACFGVSVDATLAQGDTVRVTLSDPTYTVDWSATTWLEMSLFEAEVSAIHLLDVPLGEYTHEGPADVVFDIPVVGDAPQLSATRLSFSNDPDLGFPYDTPFQVRGLVSNLSRTQDVPEGVHAVLEWRPSAGGAWSTLVDHDLGGLPTGRSEFVLASVEAGTLDPGEYDVRLVVDPDDALVEADELDNVATRTLTILDIEPDLSVDRESIGEAEVVPANQSYTLVANVTNDPAATLDSGAFDVSFAVRDRDTGAFVEVGTTRVASLAPGATATATLVVPAPSEAAEVLEGGTHLVRVTADASGEVTESREYNNDALGGFELRDAGMDLRVDPWDLYLSYTSPLAPSDEVVAVLNVRNAGTADAQDVQVDFYRDTPTGAVWIGSGSRAWLSAGTNATFAVQFAPADVDADEAPGEWIVRAAVAPQALEDNLDNNTAVASFFVGDPRGDLEGRVEDGGVLLDGVELAVGDATTTSSAAPLAEPVYPMSNYTLGDLPQGLYTVTASRDGYAPMSRDIYVIAGNTRKLDFAMQALPEADLVGGAEPSDPAEGHPGGSPVIRLWLANIGGLLADPIGGVELGVYLNGDQLTSVTIDEPLDPGETVTVELPGTWPLPSDTDTVIGVVVDEGDAVVEESEGNNVSSVIISNPKPEVAITGVDPDPANQGEDVTLQGSATDPDGQILATEWWSDRDGLLGTGEVLVVDDLSVGTHTLTLRAVDEHGEASQDSVAGVVVRDVTGPATRLRSTPGDPLVAPASPAFRWDAVDDVSAARDIDFAWWLEGIDSDFGPWSGTRDALWRDLAEGSYTLHVEARDGAGNVGPAVTWTFTVVASSTGPHDTGSDEDAGCGCGGGAPVTPAWALIALTVLVRRRRGRSLTGRGRIRR